MYRASLWVFAACAIGCGGSTEARPGAEVGGDPRPDAALWPAGRASVSPGAPIGSLAHNLDATLRPSVFAGRALATQPWVRAPSSTSARDGLGPLYNARHCFTCHPGGGAGPLPEGSRGGVLRTGVVRLSASSPAGDPIYGTQVQTRSASLGSILGLAPARVAGEVVPEASVVLRWEHERLSYPDGHAIDLRRPRIALSELGYGPLGPGTRPGLRRAPPLFGTGLLDAIPAAALAAHADPEDRDGDGISGRLTEALDADAPAVPGRFGHRGQKPSLRAQVAAAFQLDMGITNPLFPSQPCTSAQSACLQGPHGTDASGYELAPSLLDLVTRFVASIAVPARPEALAREVEDGEVLFHRAGCADCHVPSFTTGARAEAHLAEQQIWPYSDLLVHDMGAELADDPNEGDAARREWRTAPLWAARWSAEAPRTDAASVGYLHDGRARTREEAIWWHGGEASAARARFVSFAASDRARLLAFLETL